MCYIENNNFAEYKIIQLNFTDKKTHWLKNWGLNIKKKIKRKKNKMTVSKKDER